MGEAKNKLLKDLKKAGNKAFAVHHAKFFQTHKGGYGEGDKFWGLKVPQQRKLSRLYRDSVSPEDVRELLRHEVHEVRFTALMILIEHFKKADEKNKKKIV